MDIRCPLLLALAVTAAACAARMPPDSADVRHKITFDVEALDREGLHGPPDGKRALSYEFCIPDTPACRAEVGAIDPTVQFMPGSRGRIGCGADQCLCIGSTHQKDYRRVLRELSRLPYVARIDECFFE